VIRALRELLPSNYPIVGVGGVMTGADARAKLEAGADLVQLYTGLIYRGPALVGECARAARDFIRTDASVSPRPPHPRRDRAGAPLR
jgi:dihydroorotate dehydrogenase